VQAPFRIYYAYNVHRLSEELVAQNPFFNQTDINNLKLTLQSVDPTLFPFVVNRSWTVL